MKKLSSETIDNIHGVISCVITGLCLIALIMMGQC